MATPAGKEDSAQDHGSDLSTILTTEERVDLTLLIGNITEHVRKQITDTFDASITSAKKPQYSFHIAKKNPNIDDSKPHKETDEEEKARKLRERREKELSAPKMLELKRDSLDYFDKWRESVVSRVGTVVNNPQEVTEEQKEKATSKASPEAAPPESKIIREYCIFPMSILTYLIRSV
jgi:hypothetical protein